MSGRPAELAPGIEVKMFEPERMNLLGLMLSALLARRLDDPAGVRHARALRGDVLLQASGMQVTLRFRSGLIEVDRRVSDKSRARVQGTLTALLGAALGRDRVRNFLAGRLRIRGGPLTLWHVLGLIKG